MSCVTCCAVLLELQLLDIMIVQFRNEKVSNHGSIPITIDCNVVAFIVFEEVRTNDSTAHKAHQTVSFSGCNGVSAYTCGLASLQMRQFCLMTSSLDSQNDWKRVEFESHHRSSYFDQLIENEKDLRRNGSEKSSHTAISVNHFLASKNIHVAPQPPYSPDLSPCDFFLFPKLKNHLKGHHFGTLENIQTAVTDQLKAIPISEFHQ
ncbi:uncharacterized protein TNCV_2223011 [Trichonephila clavipes]|nr:uncharacterized protein TNCV_2223011 [Trichonephila clavipes]